MTRICTRCEGTGVLNLEQLSEEILDRLIDMADLSAWLVSDENKTDAKACDCCGDGKDWYAMPGEHYNPEDPPGPNGPYAYNGGLCECD